jgi:hypothetical protein
MEDASREPLPKINKMAVDLRNAHFRSATFLCDLLGIDQKVAASRVLYRASRRDRASEADR